MIKTKFSIEYNQKTMQLLKENPKKICYGVARQFLDKTIKYIPRKTGTMRESTSSYGVKDIGTGYEIASDTKYAKYVYDMNNSTTNWTTTGTESQWFHTEWQRQGVSIATNVIARNEIK